MNAEAKAIFEQAQKLTPEQKRELISLIWDSLGGQPFQLSQEQIAELERRERLFKGDPSRSIPWEQAHKEIRGEFERRRKELGHPADAS
ncbi:MAG: addiction module protein [Planctomycetes bacterium]|nr:addiction module protein [Planctomycetota bacterium]